MPTLSAGQTPWIPSLRDSSSASGEAELLTLEPSRLLGVWWLALHALIGLALLMTNLWLAGAALPVLVLHARWRRPAGTRLIVITGQRFGLPAEGRFDLALMPASDIGAWSAELVFDDRPGVPRRIYRDQLDSAAWRRLRLAITESR
jgi:hypothetical protein